MGDGESAREGLARQEFKTLLADGNIKVKSLEEGIVPQKSYPHEQGNDAEVVHGF